MVLMGGASGLVLMENVVEQGFWGAVLKGLVKKVATLWILLFFLLGGGMVRFWWGCWLEFVRVCPCSRRCVLEFARVCP